MPERDRYIPGVPCWVDTNQPDPEAAVDFYSRLFGWECTNVMPPEAPSPYFIARLRGQDVAAIAGPSPDAAPHAAWNTYVWVESADETASTAVDAGGTIVHDPFDVGDAGRMAVLADPDGAVVHLWEAHSHRGAAIVNEPGSVNFNGLHARDVTRARAFYSVVFGWTTLALPGGAEMWTRPGYGDHLALDRPNLREEIAAVGAPAGFEDVVATLSPIPDDQPEMRPHWDVTFAVEDADAIADAATRLGGTVLVAPFDAPWVRMAVIADPQGASFIASKFVPQNADGTSEASATTSAA